MPALRNARQERFAQALALGLSPHEAYERAGYTPGVRAAAAVARLQGSTVLKARIAELAARAAGAERARAGAPDVTALEETAPHRATSNGATANGTTARRARSNGASAEKPAQIRPETSTPNGALADTPTSDVTAPDTAAPDNSPPRATTPAGTAPGPSVAALIGELEEARQLAIEVRQPAAAVSATMSKARIAGLVGEKGEARPEDRLPEISDIEMARRIALILARGIHATADEATH